MVEDDQKFFINGLESTHDANKILNELESSGYYQCSVDLPKQTLIIPLSHAQYISDIEEILLNLGYEIKD